MSVPPTAASPLAALYPYVGENPDYDGLREVLQTSVPFNNHVGLTVAEVSPLRGRVEIGYRPELTNAFGTLHAGVLFLAADMAGSAAFIGAVARRLRDLTMFVLKDCRIAFLKPGVGDVMVSASVDEITLATGLADREGRKVGCDAKAFLYDARGTLIGKAYLEFSFALAAADRG